MDSETEEDRQTTITVIVPFVALLSFITPIKGQEVNSHAVCCIFSPTHTDGHLVQCGKSVIITPTIELQINIHCFLTHSSWRRVKDLQMVLEGEEGEEGGGNFEINETGIRDSKSPHHLWSSGDFGGPCGFQSDKTSSWCLSTFLFLFASMPSEQKA